MTMFSKLTAVSVAMTLATAKKDKECTDGSEPTFCLDGATPVCDPQALVAVLTEKEQWECQLNGEEVEDAKAECVDGSKPKYCQDGTEPVKVDDDEGKKGDADDAKTPDCVEGETPTYCSDGAAPTCEQTVGGDVITAVQDEKKEDKWRCEDSQGDKVKGTYPTCTDGSEPEASCKTPKNGPKDVLTAPGGSEDDCKKHERTYCESGTLTACEKDSDPCVPIAGSRRRPGAKGPRSEDLCVDATGAVLGEPTCQPEEDNTLQPPVAP